MAARGQEGVRSPSHGGCWAFAPSTLPVAAAATFQHFIQVSVSKDAVRDVEHVLANPFQPEGHKHFEACWPPDSGQWGPLCLMEAVMVCGQWAGVPASSHDLAGWCESGDVPRSSLSHPQPPPRTGQTLTASARLAGFPEEQQPHPPVRSGINNSHARMRHGSMRACEQIKCPLPLLPGHMPPCLFRPCCSKRQRKIEGGLVASQLAVVVVALTSIVGSCHPSRGPIPIPSTLAHSARARPTSNQPPVFSCRFFFFFFPHVALVDDPKQGRPASLAPEVLLACHLRPSPPVSPLFSLRGLLLARSTVTQLTHAGRGHWGKHPIAFWGCAFPFISASFPSLFAFMRGSFLLDLQPQPTGKQTTPLNT